MRLMRQTILALLLSLPCLLDAEDFLVSGDMYPPGRLVDIGGHRMHIYCQGQGEPTVILDSGAGGFSLEWFNIQKAISPYTRVCAYDRAGYGWSDMGPLPRTSKRIVGELRSLLSEASVPGPYIMVGHSFGGFTAQYFARHYPEDISGVVLIDSSHPEQAERLPRAVKKPRARRPLHTRSYSISRPVLHARYPKETGAKAFRLMSSWRYRFTRQEEMLSLPQSAREILKADPLPYVPLVVLTRGKRVWPNNGYGDEMEKVWMELQDELSLLSDGAVHLIAERSGHSIHLDQPELVISALRIMLDN